MERSSVWRPMRRDAARPDAGSSKCQLCCRYVKTSTLFDEPTIGWTGEKGDELHDISVRNQCGDQMSKTPRMERTVDGHISCERRQKRTHRWGCTRHRVGSRPESGERTHSGTKRQSGV